MARKKPQKLLCEIKKNKKQATMWRKIKYGKGCAVAVSELKKYDRKKLHNSTKYCHNLIPDFFSRNLLIQ